MTRPVAAVAALLGLCALLVTACETEKYDALCTTSPPSGSGQLGTVKALVDVPDRISPGATFTVTVTGMWVSPGVEDAPPAADAATFSVAGSAMPSGQVTVGTPGGTAPWPHDFQLTATGNPGDSIQLTLVGASRGPLTCTPLGDANFVQVMISG